MKNLISFVLYFIVPNYRVGNQHFLQLVDKNLFTFLKLIFHIYDITQILVKYVLIGIGRQMKHKNISRKVWGFDVSRKVLHCVFVTAFLINIYHLATNCKLIFIFTKISRRGKGKVIKIYYFVVATFGEKCAANYSS